MRFLMIAVMTFSTFGTAYAGLADMLKNLEKALNEAGNAEVAPAPSAKVSDQATYNTTDIGPGGIEATCDQIRAAETGNTGYLFNIKAPQWTPEILEFLIAKADSCAEIRIKKEPATSGATGISTIRGSNQIIKNNIKHAYAQHQVSDESKKREALRECYASDEFKLFEYQQGVIETNNLLTDIRSIQKRERKISQESGVRDLAAERKLGEAIVLHTERRDIYFKYYKELGGKANSADKVMPEYTNPC